jgi:pyruvate kinase
MNFPSKKTKIVCTIGPASEGRETLEAMIRGGMNVARLNFAHGDFESHTRLITTIREAAAAVGERVAIMGDLPGPKIRIGKMEEESVQLQRGDRFILQTEEIVGNRERVYVDFGALCQVVTPGDRIFVNDGFIQLQVVHVTGTEVHCDVLSGGELRSYKGVNFPGIDLHIGAFTGRDRELLAFAAEQKLDAISQSFVQDRSDLEEVRAAATGLGYQPFIIAKVERSRAVERIDEILEQADGIMVARGDLGVEIPIEDVAMVQKRLIRLANSKGKPVITATHMLESMTEHTRPTRAEATDVANAILDGTDCVMLSGETATGRFPVEAVALMARIAQRTEPHSRVRRVDEVLETAKAQEEISQADLVALTVYLSVEAVKPRAIVTPTLSGNTPRLVSRFRLPMWIGAISPHEETCQLLQFSYGVFPVLEPVRPERWDIYAREWLHEFGINEGRALLTRGRGTGRIGTTNQIEIIDLGAPADDSRLW